MNIWKNRDWKPMLLNKLSKPFNNDNFLYEIKFDGIRAILFVSSKEIHIMSRNNEDLTKYFPELESIKKLVKENTIFDGELVSFEKNSPNFKNVMKRIRLKNTEKIKNEAKNNPIIFICFDILYKNKDLRALPLTARKKYLNKFSDTDEFVKIKYIEKDGIKLFKEIKKLKLEGIVAKNKNGLYHINKRTDDYIKIKNIQIDDFYIGGYEEKKNNIISLALGEYINGLFVFVGKTSINKKKLIYKDVIKSKKSKNYFSNFQEDINFIKPIIKCRIEYLERTSNNRLRHPKFKDL